MSAAVLAALLMAVVCAALAALGPRVIARLPEPEPAAREDAEPDERALPEKPLYVDLAARSGLSMRLGIAGAIVGGLIGAALGLDSALVIWAFLTPVLIWLAWIDWHTRLLPTKIIAPTYVVLVALVLVAALLARLTTGEWGNVTGAGLGWLVVGGIYLVLWLIYPAGLGYGDVRLSGLLGMALGYLGSPQLIVGAYGGFLLGAIGGIILKAMGRTQGRHFPFGPFMVAGAFIGASLSLLVPAYA